MSGLQPPLEVILAWPTPNYADPETRGPAGLITACVLGPLMLCIVGARIWARAVIQRNAGLDDWLMVAAMVPTIGLTVTVCLATERYDYDRHIWDVRPTMFVPERKIAFVCYLLYVVGAGMIKISILLFYRRLDSRSLTRTFRIATWISIVGIVGFVVSFVLVLCLMCQPLSAFWDQFDMVKVAMGYKYHCGVNEGADLIAAGIISAAQDAAAAFLPTILYWNLQIPRRQKIALGFIFALGYLVCATAAVRAYYVYRLFNSPVYDSTWESWPAWLTCMVEVQLGAMCASAPAMKVFLSHYFHIVTTKIGSSGSSTKVVSWGKMDGSNGSKTLHSKRSSQGYLRGPALSRLTVTEQGAIELNARISVGEEPMPWR